MEWGAHCILGRNRGAGPQTKFESLCIHINLPKFLLKHPELLRILEHSIPTTTININN